MNNEKGIAPYNDVLLSNRGWISKIPDSKKAVMIFSGGFDSTITATRLIKEHGMELFPIYFDRGQDNKESELTSIEQFTKYIRKNYGNDCFHDLQVLKIDMPPKEIKEQLQPYAHKNKNYYSLRNFMMQLFAVQYAVTLGDDVTTVCDGITVNDPNGRLILDRVYTLAICEMMKNNNWNILSLNLDTEISEKAFLKRDEVMWADKNNIPYEYTMTCWSPIKTVDEILHCGECYTCKQRKMAFKNSGVSDTTKYYK